MGYAPLLPLLRVNRKYANKAPDETRRNARTPDPLAGPAGPSVAHSPIFIACNSLTANIVLARLGCRLVAVAHRIEGYSKERLGAQYTKQPLFLLNIS